MGTGLVIVSVVASSAVAPAAVAAQVWQGHLNRQSEQRAWMRDKRADTYIAIFRLFEKTPADVSQLEWEELMAKVRIFASPAMAEFFTEWGEAARQTWDDQIPDDARVQAYDRADAAQRRMFAQVIREVQSG